MTYTEFKTWASSKGMTETEAMVSLIKEKHPSVIKLKGKGRYALLDDNLNQIVRTKGLKIS